MPQHVHEILSLSINQSRKIVKAKVTSAEVLMLWWAPLHARYFGHRCCLVQDALKGEIPEHLDVFSSTMSQRHGYNTRNGYMPLISRPRMKWGRKKRLDLTAE